MPRATSNAPTLEDVARVAGVSRATASRAVRGEAFVSPATKEAVEAAIKELGYVPNRMARSLATKQTDTIAVVVSEPDSRLFSDPFFAATIAGVVEVLEPTDKNLTLMVGHLGFRRKLEAYLRSGYADGVVVISHHEDDHLPRLLEALEIPCAFVGRPIHAPRTDNGFSVGDRYVDTDNIAGGKIATARLIEAGCTKIATITGPLDMAAAVDRLTGCQQALAEAGLPLLAALPGGFTPEGAQVKTLGLLRDHPEVDGIFVASDLMAAGVLGVLHAQGRKVPDEIKVVGFDNAEIAAATVPALTTVTNPGRELARQATTMVLDELASTQASGPVIVTPELVVRDSA